MSEAAGLVFGNSPGVIALLRDAKLFARTRHPILILGEPGVGKTALARAIHKWSGRPGRFVKQPTAWIAEHIEVGQLGGHTQGAFTDARESRVGLIEAAHRGTFFLDELGLARPSVQQLLLQLLEDRTIRRVGEVRDRPVDVRFIAATNADLDELVESRLFRADLRHRFGYFTLRVPPLADRRDEILPLAALFIAREAKEGGADQPPTLGEAARWCLLEAPWRGNIRELEMVCQAAVVRALPRDVIELGDLPDDFVAPLGRITRTRHTASRADRARAALARTNGNKTQAARLLGCSRQHLYRMLGTLATFVLLAAPPAHRPHVTVRTSHRTAPSASARGPTRFGRVA